MLYSRRKLGDLCSAPPHFSCSPAAPTHSHASPAPLRTGSTHQAVGRGAGATLENPCQRKRWLQEAKKESHPDKGCQHLSARLCLCLGGWLSLHLQQEGAGDKVDSGHLLNAPLPRDASVHKERCHRVIVLFAFPPCIKFTPLSPLRPRAYLQEAGLAERTQVSAMGEKHTSPTSAPSPGLPIPPP